MSTTWSLTDTTLAINGAGLIATATANAEQQARSVASASSGKLYAEATYNPRQIVNDANVAFGIASASHPILTNYLGEDLTSIGGWGDGSVFFNNSDGTIGANTSMQIGSAPTTQAMAVDFGAMRIWWKNLTAAGNWNNNALANPATGVGGFDISTLTGAPFFLACDIEKILDAITLNTGATSYVGTAPAGFGNWGATASGVVFRRSLSPLGTRVGTRQIQVH